MKLALHKRLFRICSTLIIISYLVLPPLLQQTVYAQAAPYLTLNNFSGHAGVTIQVSGGNYQPNETITLFLGKSNVESMQTSASGSFGPVPLQIPLATPQGSISITGTANQPNGDSAQNAYYVTPFTPTLQVSSTSNTPLSQLSIQGSGFGPQEAITIGLGKNTTSITADGNGNFTGAQLQIPVIPPATYPITAQGNISQALATTYYYVGGFYPSVFPSSYYILPQQTVAFSGSGFANGEDVQVFIGKSTIPASLFTTDNTGTFKNAGSIIIPFSLANSTQTFTLKGELSGAQTSTTISIGNYYPSITPSAYFVMPGDILNFSGANFANSEDISIFEGLDTAVLNSFSAGTNGSFMDQGNITIPFTFAGSTRTYTLTGKTSNASASTTLTVGKYFPNASPSSYYVLPGKQLSFSGTGYVPGEKVSITEDKDPTILTTITTNAKGSFLNMGALSIPYANQGTQHTFHLRGSQSLTTTDLTISVGQLLPQLISSSYYVKPGQNFTVTGTGFAPNEMVILKIGDAAPISGIADTFGNVQFLNVLMPFNTGIQSGKPITLNLQGETSNAVATTSITLGSYFPSISASSYYILPGKAISFNGSGFAPNEDILVQEGLTKVTTLQTDKAGTILPNTFTIPFGQTGKITYTFTGSLSNASTSLSVTLAAFTISVISDTYYALPGSTALITAKGFVPNENVTITIGTASNTSLANTLGTAIASVTIPFGITAKSVSVQATGNESMATGSTTISLASFYPQITPSTYYAQQGSLVTFTGSGFVPGEIVTGTMNKTYTFMVTADKKGEIATSPITLPYGVNNANFTFVGNLSNTPVSNNIGLSGFYPGLTLGNYYAIGGTPITITGTGYLPKEPITLVFGNIPLGPLTADAKGAFSFATTVPYAPAGTQHIIATGVTTQATAQTTFTQAPVYVSVQLETYAGKPGTVITFIGSGYLPGETVNVTTDRTGSSVVASFKADASGSFTDASFIIPQTFTEGTLHLTITGEESLNPQTVAYYVNHS